MCGSLRLRTVPRKNEQIGDPNYRQPKIRIPLRLRIFLRLRNADKITGRCNGDEELETPEHKPWRDAAEQARPTGSLHDVKRGCDQDVPTKCENNR